MLSAHRRPVAAAAVVVAAAAGALTGCGAGGSPTGPSHPGAMGSAASPVAVGAPPVAPAPATAAGGATRQPAVGPPDAGVKVARQTSHPAAAAAFVGPGASTVTVPPVVAAAMHALPRAAGLEAPTVLPSLPRPGTGADPAAAAATASAVSAQTSALGGTESVTLVATPTAHPVNDPTLQAGDGADLGTFTSTAVATAAAATDQVAGMAAATLATCAAPATAITLAATSAASCPTALGPAIGWSVGAWRVQAVDVDDAGPPTGPAGALAGWLAAHHLPDASAGLVQIAVTGGVASTSLTWAAGPDVYATRSSLTPTAAADLAASMRPWQG